MAKLIKEIAKGLETLTGNVANKKLYAKGGKVKKRKTSTSAKAKTKAKQKKVSQTEAGRRQDKQRKAKRVGWRYSEDGNLYYEDRSNRSDKDRRKRI